LPFDGAILTPFRALVRSGETRPQPKATRHRRFERIDQLIEGTKARNLGLVIYGFGLFLISSLLWSVIGWVQREISLLVLQGTFTIINIVGICRWLGL
jgi:hypothetical protein